MKTTESKARAFKTKKFSKDAAKALILDADLCQGIEEVKAGLAVDLGGGVFKKRLNKNAHRSLLLAKGGTVWVYQFLFAKKDADNIGDDDLVALKRLAKLYQQLSPSELAALIATKEFVEICHDD
jgi:hypothetical protein